MGVEVGEHERTQQTDRQAIKERIYVNCCQLAEVNIMMSVSGGECRASVSACMCVWRVGNGADISRRRRSVTAERQGGGLVQAIWRRCR